MIRLIPSSGVLDRQLYERVLSSDECVQQCVLQCVFQQCVLGDLPLPAARHPVCLPADRWAVQENKIQNTQTQLFMGLCMGTG